MAYEPVDVYVKDKSPMPAPIANVVVKIYSADGSSFITQETTDSSGLAAFLLLSGFTYQVRFFKFQTLIPNPKMIEVFPAPTTNIFDVSGEIVSRPIATDARLCRASGYFRDPSGRAAKWVNIHFIPKFDPLLLEGAAILTERLEAKTDSSGYLEVDLIRFGKYDVTIQGMDDLYRSIEIPDASSVNLPDLLFPVISQVTFDVPTPTMAVNSPLRIRPTVYSSDGRSSQSTQTEDLVWSIDDPSICSLGVTADELVLFGNAAGTTHIRCTRLNDSVIRIPNPDVSGSPLTVTVTP
jgi:hypothetical protein